MYLQIKRSRNVGVFFAFITISFFLPVVTDANKTYVSRFSDHNYSLHTPSCAYPHDTQGSKSSEIIHRRQVEGGEEESKIKEKAKDEQQDDAHEEATTGLLNFRAASLPEEIKRALNDVTDDYMLSLDILLPQIPSSYDLQVNQVGDNSFNSNYNSQTKTSVVKETDIGLQFNTRSLRTIEIKITFEDDGRDAVVVEEPIIKKPTMTHASPVMSQTIVPEESCSPPTSFYREEIELEPILVRDVSPDGVASSLFRHMSK